MTNLGLAECLTLEICTNNQASERIKQLESHKNKETLDISKKKTYNSEVMAFCFISCCFQVPVEAFHPPKEYPGIWLHTQNWGQAKLERLDEQEFFFS
jgi:hypothetical protein